MVGFSWVLVAAYQFCWITKRADHAEKCRAVPAIFLESRKFL
jgi:hypothetical protein